MRAQNELLHHCFLAALKGGGERKVRDKDLPMLANVFYSDYMLPARPEGTTLEIKRTSYKKLHPFLAEAAGKGLIQTRETSPGVIQLTAVNRSHDEYVRVSCRHSMCRAVCRVLTWCRWVVPEGTRSSG